MPISLDALYCTHTTKRSTLSMSPNNMDLRRRNELVNHPAYEVIVFFHKVLKHQLNKQIVIRICFKELID